MARSGNERGLATGDGGPAAAPKPATDQPPEGAAGRRREAVLAGHRASRATAARLFEDGDPAVRAAALGALARTGGIGTSTLLEAIHDRDPQVRRRACEEAGRAASRTGATASGSGADEALLEALVEVLDDPAAEVAEAAAWALGENADRAGSAVPPLVHMARSHPRPLCREAAVAALGAIGDERGLPAVLEALDDKPAVRRRAAASLAAFDDDRVDDALRRCLSDRDWQVRQVAEELLREE